MNIVYKDTNDVTKISDNSTDLFDLRVYIPTSFKFDALVLYIGEELVELYSVNSDKTGYLKYAPRVNKYINYNSTDCNVHLHGIAFNSISQTPFAGINIPLSFTFYNEEALKICSYNLGNNVQETYSKIYKLTELNTKIYEAIKELRDNE